MAAHEVSALLPTETFRKSRLMAWRAAVAMETVKTLTLRSWWIGFTLILALDLYFTYNGVMLAREAMPTLNDGMVQDDLGEAVPLGRYVGDMIISAPYQSMAVFFPLLLVIVCGQDYRSGHGQLQLTALAVPSGTRRAAAGMVFTFVATVGATFTVFLISDAVLWLMLPSEARAVIVSGTGLLACLRIAVVTCVMTLTAFAVTTLARSSWAGAIFIVLQTIFSMSGLLRVMDQSVNNILPMVAAKTFLFGYQREVGEPGLIAGLVILAGWLGSSVLAVMIGGARRAVV